MEIIKGKIDNYNFETKYDDDGNEYKLFTIIINKKKYTAKHPKSLNLLDGTDIIAGISSDNPSEIIAGYCPKRSVQWGKNVRRLKKQSNPFDIYEYVEGVVIEKRKSTVSDNDFSKDALNRNTTVNYNVYIEGRNFYTPEHLGKKLKPGLHIGAVLFENWAQLVVDKKTGKITGKQKPFFVLFFLMIVAFNCYMYYVYYNQPDLMPDYKVVLIVINVFLVLFWLLSISSFVAGRKWMKFLNSNMKK